jgi:hypothetical protein
MASIRWGLTTPTTRVGDDWRVGSKNEERGTLDASTRLTGTTRACPVSGEFE